MTKLIFWDVPTEAILVYGVATDFGDKYTIEGLLRHWQRAELFLVSDAIRAYFGAIAECSSWMRRRCSRVVGSNAISRLPCDLPHSKPVRTPYLASQ
jgi:hypothetical protein